MSEPLIFIYADESCLGNQFKGRSRPGGAAGLVEYCHPERGWIRRDFWTAEPDTTNNRMAIESARVALGALKAPSRVVFTTDSRYLVDAMSSWIFGWARRGWQRKGGEIENLALWKALLPVARRHRVEWRWVKGHAGHPQNEYANHLAIRAANEQNESGGLVESGFPEWLLRQQEQGRMQSYRLPDPEKHPFKPASTPPLP